MPPRRAAGEKRGFAVARLITHWDEIVGPDTARMARPVRLGWARGQRSSGLGATLTLAVPGPAAPMVQMLAPRIIARVNAALGFAAVARVALAQGAEAPPAHAGLAEDAAPFTPRADPALAQRACAVADGVRDPALRSALEALGRSVLSRSDTSKGLP
ncbi:DUF721 domain-containing protein [Rhodobaculum claviforme]|uniref:DUF721 domain-containing protein n=1 Tax=Rhodobaculum claviforme TaxID=1549854 RepID=A0A934TIR9_9RHOB|nr:DciA family protein [Rhodobaculum claviforme]MBK5926271.1 hypothetical protein [Rhodobaculum claviforme]